MSAFICTRQGSPRLHWLMPITNGASAVPRAAPLSVRDFWHAPQVETAKATIRSICGAISRGVWAKVVMGVSTNVSRAGGANKPGRGANETWERREHVWEQLHRVCVVVYFVAGASTLSPKAVRATLTRLGAKSFERPTILEVGVQ